jgi:hypothetical protein
VAGHRRPPPARLPTIQSMRSEQRFSSSWSCRSPFQNLATPW